MRFILLSATECFVMDFCMLFVISLEEWPLVPIWYLISPSQRYARCWRRILSYSQCYLPRNIVWVAFFRKNNFMRGNDVNFGVVRQDISQSWDWLITCESFCWSTLILWNDCLLFECICIIWCHHYWRDQWGELVCDSLRGICSSRIIVWILLSNFNFSMRCRMDLCMQPWDCIVINSTLPTGIWETTVWFGAMELDFLDAVEAVGEWGQS